MTQFYGNNDEKGTLPKTTIGPFSVERKKQNPNQKKNDDGGSDVLGMTPEMALEELRKEQEEKNCKPTPPSSETETDGQKAFRAARKNYLNTQNSKNMHTHTQAIPNQNTVSSEKRRFKMTRFLSSVQSCAAKVFQYACENKTSIIFGGVASCGVKAAVPFAAKTVATSFGGAAIAATTPAWLITVGIGAGTIATAGIAGGVGKIIYTGFQKRKARNKILRENSDVINDDELSKKEKRKNIESNHKKLRELEKPWKWDAFKSGILGGVIGGTIGFAAGEIISANPDFLKETVKPVFEKYASTVSEATKNAFKEAGPAITNLKNTISEKVTNSVSWASNGINNGFDALRDSASDLMDKMPSFGSIKEKLFGSSNTGGSVPSTTDIKPLDPDTTPAVPDNSSQYLNTDVSKKIRALVFGGKSMDQMINDLLPQTAPTETGVLIDEQNVVLPMDEGTPSPIAISEPAAQNPLVETKPDNIVAPEVTPEAKPAVKPEIVEEPQITVTAPPEAVANFFPALSDPNVFSQLPEKLQIRALKAAVSNDEYTHLNVCKEISFYLMNRTSDSAAQAAGENIVRQGAEEALNNKMHMTPTGKKLFADLALIDARSGKNYVAAIGNALIAGEDNKTAQLAIKIAKQHEPGLLEKLRPRVPEILKNALYSKQPTLDLR